MIEIEVSHLRTCVSFSHLATPHFQVALTEFKRMFPDARWSKQDNAWLMSSRAFSKVTCFAYAHFPAELVVIRVVAPPPRMLFV